MVKGQVEKVNDYGAGAISLNCDTGVKLGYMIELRLQSNQRDFEDRRVKNDLKELKVTT